MRASQAYRRTALIDWITTMQPLIQLALFFLVISSCAPTLRSQQEYYGLRPCDDSKPNPSSSYLYTCNSPIHSCRAFLIFKSQPSYNTVGSISSLFSSDPVDLARINGDAPQSQIFPDNQEVIVPVNCSCDGGQYYQANTSYIRSDVSDTYYRISNGAYQGLASCKALIGENPYNPTNIPMGARIVVPLRCACPTKNQTKYGIRYLLSYSIVSQDKLPNISSRFNASNQDTMFANGFVEQDPLTWPITVVLIPLKAEPLYSQTVIHQYQLSPAYPPVGAQDGVDGKRRHSKTTIVTGVSIGALASVLVFATLFVFYRRRRKKMDLSRKATLERSLLPDHLQLGMAGVEHKLKVYRFEQVNSATNSFGSDCKVGGSVYCGIIGGSLVAIKETGKDAIKEVNILHKLNHFNLIRLYGLCMAEERQCYVLYEYMENGSLRDWLHDSTKIDPKPHLSWSQRVQIAVDIAKGLDYLHNFTYPPYVHTDINSGNILLNGDFRAKITNFSLAQSTELGESRDSEATTVQGTIGYMSPEYVEFRLVTPKLDVYAFGVVLLELITGKDVVTRHNGKDVLLTARMVSIIEGGDAETELGDLLDSTCKCRIDFALTLAKLGVACLKPNPASRPSMDMIVSALEMVQRDLHSSESPSTCSSYQSESKSSAIWQQKIVEAARNECKYRSPQDVGRVM